MIYSSSAKMWCVRPTLHTNYIDVVDWCVKHWGHHRIDNVCDGSWSYCEGSYYGLTQTLGKITVGDSRVFFSFVHQEDALFFLLRWT